MNVRADAIARDAGTDAIARNAEENPCLRLGTVCDVVLRELYDDSRSVDPQSKFRQVYRATPCDATRSDATKFFGDEDLFAEYMNVVVCDVAAWLNDFPPNFGSKPQYDKIKGYFKRLLFSPSFRDFHGAARCDAWWRPLSDGFRDHAPRIIERRVACNASGRRHRDANASDGTGSDGAIANLDEFEGWEEEEEEGEEAIEPAAQPTLDTTSNERLVRYKKRVRELEDEARAREVAESRRRLEVMRDVFEAFARKKCSDDEFFYIQRVIQSL